MDRVLFKNKTPWNQVFAATECLVKNGVRFVVTNSGYFRASFPEERSGVSKGGFLWGGEISIIGVARAPVAIINFASNPCENLRVYIGFNKELPHKNIELIIATGVCTTPAHPNYWDFPPSPNPPFGNPQKEEQQNFTQISRPSRPFPWRLLCTVSGKFSLQHFCKPCRDDTSDVPSRASRRWRQKLLLSPFWSFLLIVCKWFVINCPSSVNQLSIVCQNCLFLGC